MPKISQIEEVPCQAEVRILQKITLNINTIRYYELTDLTDISNRPRYKEVGVEKNLKNVISKPDFGNALKSCT